MGTGLSNEEAKGAGRRVVAIALGLAGALGALVACEKAPPAEAPLASTSESWCPDGFEVGPRDTCFAIPEAHGPDTPVLVYLHGMYAGHGSPEEWRVVHGAVDAGFAVVIPRGKRGLCAWKAELRDHFCWPHEVEDPQAFKSIVADWERVLWQVDALLESGSHKRYVLGFSNGGFFGAYLAEHGLFPADAYAIVGGGPLEAARVPEGAPPLLLVSTSDAPSSKAKELHDSLSRAGWSHTFCTRSGGDALSAADVDLALGFFRRAGGRALHTAGGAYQCEAPPKGPRAHKRKSDAGARAGHKPDAGARPAHKRRPDRKPDASVKRP